MEKEIVTIICIGVDEKLHVCLPWMKTTKCGVSVKKKIVKDQDYTKRFWCGDCD